MYVNNVLYLYCAAAFRFTCTRTLGKELRDPQNKLAICQLIMHFVQQYNLFLYIV